MSLRKHIASKPAMQELRNALRQAFTPNELAQLLTDTITDPSVQAAMTKAIGQKGDNALSVRTADTIAATLLGFNNAHEMLAHYKDVMMVREWRFIHVNRHEDSPCDYWVEDGVDFTVLDALALCGCDFEHDRADEHFNDIGTSDLVPADSKQAQEAITAKSDAPAVALSMSRGDTFVDFTPEPGRVESAFGLLEEMIGFMSTGQPFAWDPERLLCHYGSNDMDFFAVNQPKAEGTSPALVEYLVYESATSNLCDLLPSRLNWDLISTLTPAKDAGKWVYNLGDGYILWFDPIRLMFILGHNDKPLFGGGIHLSANDARRPAFEPQAAI